MGGFLLDGDEPQASYRDLLRDPDNERLRGRLAPAPSAEQPRAKNPSRIASTTFFGDRPAADGGDLGYSSQMQTHSR